MRQRKAHPEVVGQFQDLGTQYQNVTKKLEEKHENGKVTDTAMHRLFDLTQAAHEQGVITAEEKQLRVDQILNADSGKLPAEHRSKAEQARAELRNRIYKQNNPALPQPFSISTTMEQLASQPETVPYSHAVALVPNVYNEFSVAMKKGNPSEQEAARMQAAQCLNTFMQAKDVLTERCVAEGQQADKPKDAWKKNIDHERMHQKTLTVYAPLFDKHDAILPEDRATLIAQNFIKPVEIGSGKNGPSNPSM